ncbi:hypothetical protein [Agrococcus sp. HG114]|uniref:hypothetical protein n=1 Tax=Agrococcus sp. HG114 TaxID=2969757 RepID=UPI00215AFCB8|nr:hypothetical protein [Agrococcus sp. HG114]MCR8671079.1 hypothetical protein [Agrococcus sp. HG114]
MNAAAPVGRATATVALAVALTMIGATAASAHHCYKDEWADAAYQHHLRGGTPWVPLSDLGAQFLIPPELQDDCGYVADEVVADFMADYGLQQEPLIHTRATVGSGAAYQGKDVRPFSYLTEEQFGVLTVSMMDALAVCAAG